MPKTKKSNSIANLVQSIIQDDYKNANKYLKETCEAKVSQKVKNVSKDIKSI